MAAVHCGKICKKLRARGGWYWRKYPSLIADTGTIWLSLKHSKKSMDLHTGAHPGHTGQVMYNDDFSNTLTFESGVKYGCVLATTQFAIFFSILIHKT